MICPFCKQEHDNEGDRYGCPWCHGEGLNDMSCERKYYALVAELEQLERATGLYLTDPCVDRENAAHAHGTDDWWPALLSAAKCAAGGRAEEAGQDINALLGRVIY